MEKVKYGIFGFCCILIFCIVIMIQAIIHNEGLLILYSFFGGYFSVTIIFALCNIVKENTIYLEKNLKYFTMNKIATLLSVNTNIFFVRSVATVALFIMDAIIGTLEIVHTLYKKGVRMQKVEDETL